MARKKNTEDSGGAFRFDDSDFLKTARARFKLAEDAERDQLEQEREDLGFYAGDQWPVDIRLARMGQQPTNGMPAVPSRPTLVINNVREPVRQVVNEAQQADLGIEITAAEDFGDLAIIPDDTEIQLREGLVRRIQRQSHARDARMWAYDRAVKAGRGYYQVCTRYLPVNTTLQPSIAAADQEIYLYRLYDQSMVRLDPSHMEPDGSDAEWEFVATDMLWDQYVADYPTIANGEENPIANRTWSDAEWEQLGNGYPNWFIPERKGRPATRTEKAVDDRPRAVRVVQYFYATYEKRELVIFDNDVAAWMDEIPKEKKKGGKKDVTEPWLPEGATKVLETRWVSHRTIRVAHLDGAQVLDDVEWPGPDMPIIKVMGEELQPYDNKRHAEGMVRPARDSQMGLNYMISKQVEMIGLTPLTPLITDPDAIEGFPEYDVLNTRVVPYARYRTYDDQGRQLKEPHRPNADPNLLPISQSIALFSEQIEKTTNVPGARVGQIEPVTRSGKAIQALTANSQLSTSNFLQNLVRSLRYEGQVVNNLLYPIYGGRQGRLVRILTGEGDSQLVAISDTQDQMQLAQLRQRAESVAKLTKDAHFNVNVKVTRDFDTRRDEESQRLGELIGANPQLMSWFGDLWLSNQDWPGHKEAASRAEVMLAPPIQQMRAAKANGQAPMSPREMMLTQQLQQAHGLLQQASLDKAGQTIKGQFDLQKTTIQESAENTRNRENNFFRLAVAEVAAKQDRFGAQLDTLMDRLGLQFEAQQAGLDRAHDVGLAQMQQSHDAQQQQVQGQQAIEQGHQQVAAQLATQPPPSSNGDGGGAA